MAGKADLTGSIVHGMNGTDLPDDAAYASLFAAEAAGAEAERGGWVADG